MDLGKVRLARGNLRLLRLHEHEFQDAYNIIQKKLPGLKCSKYISKRSFSQVGHSARRLSKFVSP
jgi:hypothetical protein